VNTVKNFKVLTPQSLLVIVEPSGSAAKILAYCLSEKHRRYITGGFSILTCIGYIIAEYVFVFHMALGRVCSCPCAIFYVI
jgi:hypothetical protein